MDDIGIGQPQDPQGTSPDMPSQPVKTAAERRWAVGMAVMLSIIVLTLVTAQVFLISSMNDTKSEIEAMQAQLGSIDDSVSALSDDLAVVSGSIEEAASAPQVEGGGSSALDSPAASAPPGYLPRFDKTTQDGAVGMTLGPIEGVDAYTAETVSFDPADGTKRIWMIWAHWCPFCQQELPLLTDWYPTVSDDYETELVTVSTSIDPSRGNPLEAYLAESQFPFPVVVDANSDAAIKMGVSAFPFWVVTDGDGEVLLRTTGLLELAQVQSLLDQMENLGS
jgi:thiol-disulfide isomerase/thioredoxin